MPMYLLLFACTPQIGTIDFFILIKSGQAQGLHATQTLFVGGTSLHTIKTPQLPILGPDYMTPRRVPVLGSASILFNQKIITVEVHDITVSFVNMITFISLIYNMIIISKLPL